jgi:hypothetical protein
MVGGVCGEGVGHPPTHILMISMEKEYIYIYMKPARGPQTMIFNN